MIALTYLLALVLAVVLLALVYVAYRWQTERKNDPGDPLLLEMSMDEIVKREG